MPFRQIRRVAGSLNRRDLVLAILAASGGRPYTPVQIQKSVFVICDQLPDLISGLTFSFRPYDYGPFDSDVYSEISMLQHAGEAIIAPAPFGNWNTYAASDAGVIRGQKLLDQIGTRREYIEKISAWVRSLGFNSLVKSIYEAYPEMKANSIFRG
jgi:hypothetical protein